MFPTSHMFRMLVAFSLIAIATPVFSQSVEDENRLAAGFYSRQQWDESAVAFQKLIKRYPKTTEAATGHFFLGEALMQQGAYSQAYPIYQIFLQRLPQHEFAPRATFRMGEAAFRSGNYDSAIRMIEIFVTDNPHDRLNEFALPYLGEMRLKRIEPQLAQRAYETALRLFPQGRMANECRFGLARALQMQGADPDAVRFYEFIAAQPDNPLAGEAELQMAVMAVHQSDFPTADEHFAKALPKCTKVESKCEASYWLARSCEMKGDHARAFELLEPVVGKTVTESLATAIYFDAAIAATKLKKDQLADRWLSELITTYPANELADKALHLRIELHQQSKNEAERAEVEQLIQQFTQLFPHSRLKPRVLETAGRNLYADKQYERSVTTFENLLTDDLHFDDDRADLDRTNWRYMQSLGYLGLERFDDAEAALVQIDFVTASDELKPLHQLALATARFGQQKYQHAIPNYRSYLQLIDGVGHIARKDKIRANTELTICLAESGMWSEAVEAFSQLKTIQTHHDRLLETAEYLADKSHREHQPTSSISWHEFLIETETDPEAVARAISGLAWLKMETGDAAGAATAFQRLVDEFPDSEFTAPAALARAKALDDAQDYRQSAQMYGLVIRRFGTTEFAKIARLKRAAALQKLATPTDLKEAKTLLQEYLEMGGDLPAKDEALYQLGWANLDLNLDDEAIKNFRELLEKYPDSKYRADASFRLAQQEAQQQNLDAASALLASIQHQTDVPDAISIRALFLFGEIAAKQDRWESVSQTMEQLLQRSDEEILTTKANYWLAESLFRQRKFAAAGEIFKDLTTEYVGLDEKLKPWIWLRQAQCLGQQNRWSEAMEVAVAGKQQFEDFSADYEFDFLRARATEDSGRLNDARLIYQSVVDSPRGGATETAAIAQWRIGETFFHQENYVDAIEAYYKVDSLFSHIKWRSAALLQAGKCQEHLGNWNQAKKLYVQLIDKFADNEYATSAKQRLERVALLAKVEQEHSTGTR